MRVLVFEYQIKNDPSDATMTYHWERVISESDGSACYPIMLGFQPLFSLYIAPCILWVFLEKYHSSSRTYYLATYVD